MSKTMAAHAVPVAPTPVGETWNTPGSAPVGAQVEKVPSCPHDGIRVMPGSAAGHGKGSPKLHTVLTSLVFGAELLLRSWIDAGSPVSPMVAALGKVGAAAPP